MIIGVDHLLVAVESVERAMEVYRRLGFEVLAGGEHLKMGTYNALVPLSDGSYLELIGVRDPDKAVQFPNTRSVVAALTRENRLASFALDTNDISNDVLGLRARGLEIGDPIPGERNRPDGKKVAWRTAHFENPNLPFLIEDMTPRELRVPLPTQGLGARAYLAEVQVRVVDLADASRVWKNLLGRIPPTDDEFQLERSMIRLTPNAGQATGLSALSLAVSDFEQSAQALKGHGINVQVEGDRLEIDPGETAGARIALVAGIDAL